MDIFERYCMNEEKMMDNAACTISEWFPSDYSVSCDYDEGGKYTLRLHHGRGWDNEVEIVTALSPEDIYRFGREWMTKYLWLDFMACN